MTTIDRRVPPAAALLGFAGAVLVVAVVGALASTNARAVYDGLTLPTWAPPPWVFGPVWTTLYVLIAVSGWLFWRAGGDRRAIAIYGAGLVLNLVWSPLFFAGGTYGLALADILLLDVAVLTTIVLFRRSSPAAAWMQVPYLAWILFATALNASVVALN